MRACGVYPMVATVSRLQRSGNTDKARAEYERVAAAGAPTFRGHIDRTMFLMAAGRTDEAISAVTKHYANAPYGAFSFGEITEPGITEAWGTQLLQPNDRFATEWARLRRAAWERIGSESKQVRIPWHRARLAIVA